MTTRNITRRLECLEAYLAPPSEEPALNNSPHGRGTPGQFIEVRGDNTADLRRQPWSPRRAFKGWK
jgi:hypothetical protein